jgi:hypothetical protein
MTETTNDLGHDSIGNFVDRIEVPNQASKVGLVELAGERDEVNKPAQGRVCQALGVRFEANLVNKTRDLRDAQLGGYLCGCAVVSIYSDKQIRVGTRLKRSPFSRSDSKAASPSSRSDGIVRSSEFAVIEPSIQGRGRGRVSVGGGGLGQEWLDGLDSVARVTVESAPTSRSAGVHFSLRLWTTSSPLSRS